MIKNTVIILFFTMLYFGNFSFANAQNISTQKEFANRDRLKIRVQMLLAFDKKQEYEKLFEMLAKKQRDGYGSKESFIKFKKTAESIGGENLTKFKPKEFSLLQPTNDWALIIGCGELRWSSLNRQKTVNLSSIFNFPFGFKFYRAFVSQT